MVMTAIPYRVKPHTRITVANRLIDSEAALLNARKIYDFQSAIIHLLEDELNE